MKTKKFKNGTQMMAMLLAFLILLSMQKLVAQIVCANPTTEIYGLTGTGEVHAITVGTGAVGAKLNPPNTGNLPDLANAMGYNQLNGCFYYFKRNTLNSPQEFVRYDPVANTVTILAASPVTSIINLGCVAQDSKGYYCIDAYGGMYYYKISNNTWTTICTNIKDQFSNSLASIISNGASLSTSSRIYGDLAIDGYGHMWILISGPTNFGLYKLSANLPTVNKLALTITQILPPTTATPALQSIGGVAFNVNGEMFLSTNAGHNKLYKMQNNYVVSLVSTMTLDGIGTDLTSCNYPLFLLPVNWIDFNVSVKNSNAVLNWTVAEKNGNQGFEIEHSTNGTAWEKIGYVQSLGQEVNNQQYSFVHNNCLSGKHYYRVVGIEMKGAKSYSESRTVNVQHGAKMNVWPNPAQDILKVEVSADKSFAHANITLFDQIGRPVKGVMLEKGINHINIKSLSAGSYFLRIAFEDGETINQHFIKKAG